MVIRPYRAPDLAGLVALFTTAVHDLTGAHYDARQRDAWAPRPPDLAEWRARLASLHTWVAEDQGHLAGFIALGPAGHVELLYTAPSHVRRGIASALYRHLEAGLIAHGITTATTEASLVAAPFFSRHGFQVAERQRVLRRGVLFERYAMKKLLGGEP